MGSGSGKTLITCGLLAAWKEQGKKLSAFKCGPDYIDPMFHRTVLGVESGNLDSFFTDKDTLRFLLKRGAEGTELSIIEGVMGYFDGLGGISERASSYEVAAWTETPVVLIVNCRGMSRSVVPLIRGFMEYEGEKQIQGVILNEVSPMLYPRLKSLIEENLPVKVYGYVPRLSEGFLESRHLGLKRPEEIANLQERLKALAESFRETVDLQGLLALAKAAPALYAGGAFAAGTNPGSVSLSHRETVRVAVARDSAFDFYYRENFYLLEELGAKLLYFSPLKDREVPKEADGLILGGGYPELYGRELSENEAMRKSVKEAIENGIPCLAECGGFLYLHKTLEDESGEEWPMAGVLPGRGFRTPKLSRFGYVTLTAGEDSLLGDAGSRFPAHEFHYWDSTENGNAFLAEKPEGKRSWPCMVNRKNLLAGFPHFYYYGNRTAAENFLSACRKWRKVQERAGERQPDLPGSPPQCE
ncbi:MAG: cobyrinate a,c-diamide synthase [Lachnospiraceae bacterium]|nr:cobyrinate a,c-diamide synthase [Lachnospiraceae bacterium]